MRCVWVRCPSLVVLLLVLSADMAWAVDKSDLDVVHKIRQKAFKKSQVMGHVFHMTDVYGPRLTRSPGIQQAAQWVLETAQVWGLDNAHLEPWGPFGRGWSTSYFSAHLVEPQYSPLIGVPSNWAPGTNGVIAGTPMLVPLDWPRRTKERRRALDDFMDEYRGKLHGQIVLMRKPPDLKEIEKVPSQRLDSAALSKRAAAPEPLEPIAIDYANPTMPEDPDERARFIAHAPRYVLEKIREKQRALLYELNDFLADEGVRLAVLSSLAR